MADSNDVSSNITGDSIFYVNQMEERVRKLKKGTSDNNKNDNDGILHHGICLLTGLCLTHNVLKV